MFKNGKQNLKRILFVLIFSIFFFKENTLYSDLKLRFKEIEVKFQPINKSNREYASKVVNYLHKVLTKSGNLNEYSMTITVKKYDVIVKKEKTEKDLIDIFKKENKVYLHKVSILVEVNDSSESVIDSIPIEVHTTVIVNENLTFNQRKMINKNLYNELEVKLTSELKKKLLTRLGDFVIPN